MGVCVYSSTIIASFATSTWKGEELFIRTLNRWRQKRNIYNRRILGKVSKRGVILAPFRAHWDADAETLGLDIGDYGNNTHNDIYKLCDSVQFSLVQLLSRFWVFATPWTAAHPASLSITNSWSLLKLMSIELVIASNHFIPCCPLLLLPSIFPSIRGFSNESALHIRWPKYWSFSFNISPSDAFELWCWRRLLRVPWTARRSNQSIPKEISPECSLERLMLKLKL